MVKYIFISKQERLDLVARIVKEIEKLPQPIHLLSINFGNVFFSWESKKYFERQFKNRNIKSKTYEVWIKSINNKFYLDKTKTDFKKEDYTGTAVIIEDIVNDGYHLSPVIFMLRKIDPKKRIYNGGLFDPGKFGDFSISPYNVGF